MSAHLTSRMEARVAAWEGAADARADFLRCYLLMTRNTLAAIARDDFADGEWVGRLLRRFADYYFDALEAYERGPVEAPVVWRLAHGATFAPGATSLQRLLVGVNAHINYDLVLTLVDVLEPEWQGSSESERAARYADHCRVNDVIERTIDAVQDGVVEPAMPAMALVDVALGPLDEFLVSRLVARWRETVWRRAVRLLDTQEPGARARLVRRVERDAVRICHALSPHRAG